MEFERFFKFSQLLLRDEFVLSYSGYVSKDILEAVGDTLRQRLETMRVMAGRSEMFSQSLSS